MKNNNTDSNITNFKNPGKKNTHPNTKNVKNHTNPNTTNVKNHTHPNTKMENNNNDPNKIKTPTQISKMLNTQTQMPEL
jgi:hypothetical protein